jgi:gas vesicle protein
MSSGKVVLGMLAGLAAGAVLGILFAPEKGSKTRRQILDKGEDYADDVKAKMDNFLDMITEKFERTKGNVEEMASNGKTKFEEAKREVRGTVSDMKNNSTF